MYTVNAACNPGLEVQCCNCITLLHSNCSEGTCDGCSFHFLWQSQYACPLCTESHYREIVSACIQGIQVTSLESWNDFIHINLTDLSYWYTAVLNVWACVSLSLCHFLREPPMCGCSPCSALAGYTYQTRRWAPAWPWISGSNSEWPQERSLPFYSSVSAATSGRRHASETPCLAPDRFSFFLGYFCGKCFHSILGC